MNKKDVIEYLQSLPDDVTILWNKRNVKTIENGIEIEHKFLDAKMFENNESREFIEWFLMP